ncbi:MAG: hypothetical protein ACLPWD_05850, partial [Methanobacterium sp.]
YCLCVNKGNIYRKLSDYNNLDLTYDKGAIFRHLVNKKKYKIFAKCLAYLKENKIQTKYKLKDIFEQIYEDYDITDNYKNMIFEDLMIIYG